MIVWGAQRLWTKDHPRKLGRKKVPITVKVGKPLPPAATIDATEAAMRESMTALLHDVQEYYEHPAGAYWVPHGLGGSAPTMDEAKVLDEAEFVERARKQAEREPKTLTLPALIATDVDGTLLDDETRQVSPRTRAAVLAAVDAGAQFVLATGRPPRWVHPVVDALGFAPMAVCANGAVIYDPSTDRIVSARTLSAEALGELAEIATRIIPGAGLAVERVGRSAHDAATPAVRQLTGLRACLAQSGQHRGVRRGPAQRARHQAAHPQGGCAQCRHGRRAGQTRWSARRYHLLDQQRPHRGGAAGRQQGHRRRGGGRPLGITAADVVAFGDMPNDVPMLRWAGLGVAMGNAHPDAIAAADEVTATNADDGVARVLERWWLCRLDGVDRCETLQLRGRCRTTVAAARPERRR